MKFGNIEKKLLLDADVIIHFCKAGCFLLLATLYKNRLYVLDRVASELRKHPVFHSELDRMINTKLLTEIDLPNRPEIILEFAKLTSERSGAGESACMAYCRFHNDILASSNLRDIEEYCIEHSIEFKSTLDLVHELHQTNMLTRAECDLFIHDVFKKGSRLRYKTFQEYLDSLP